MGLLLFQLIQFLHRLQLPKNDVSCHGCRDGSASVSVTGGTPPYEFIWPGGSSGSSVTGLSPGYYVVVIVDANGCSGSASITINDQPVPPPPFIITVVASSDPNDITGPAGYGDQKWVSVKDELPYLIRFENDSKMATSAVNKVVITHPVDNMANMFSFQLGDFSFRNFSFQVPPNTSHYFKRLNMVDSMGIYLDVTAGIDVTKKQAFWIFQAFDPVTGLPNINPDLGFLLINDSISHNGEGSVRFSIKPKNNASTGDTIKAFASIVFDVNAPLLTNVAYNTIDSKPPASKIKSITTISSDVFEVNWDGRDDPKGSGVADYKLLISSNNEPYSSYDAITDTSYIVSLTGGNEYKIQSIAKDHTNNMEQLNNLPDTVFYIRPEVQLGKDLSICMYDSIVLNAGGGFSSYKWNDESTNQTLTVKTAGKYYVTAVRDAVISTDTIIIGTNQLPVPALHNNIPGFCEGDSLILNAGSGYKNYTWSTEENVQTIEVNKSGKYSVVVTDKNGCQSRDSIVVAMYSKPVISIGNDRIIVVNDSIVLIPDIKGFTSYLWNDFRIMIAYLLLAKRKKLVHVIIG